MLPRPTRASSRSTTSLTVRSSPGFGPKFSDGGVGGTRREVLHQLDVAEHRLVHELPRTNRVRVAQAHAPVGRECAEHVGHEPSFGDVASADHVAGAGRHHPHAARREELAPAVDDELARRLARAVGVASAKAVSFPKRRDRHPSSHRPCRSSRRGPHAPTGRRARRRAPMRFLTTFDLEGAHRIAVARRHQGLRREVEHALGLGAFWITAESAEASRMSTRCEFDEHRRSPQARTRHRVAGARRDAGDLTSHERAR